MDENVPAIDRWVLRVWDRFCVWFFSDGESRYPASRGGWGDKLLLAGCFLVGIAHWAGFFNAGRLDFTAHDWPKEISYLRVIREALTEWKVPLFINTNLQGTDCFLGLPETPMLPQVLLLRWMEPGQFALTNVLILFTAGFAGCCLLARQLALSRFGFVTLFLLFQFNGYLTSRLAVGHFMWSGYFFLPFLVWVVLKAGAGRDAGRFAAIGALVLSAILCQGGFHLWIWCLMFLVLLWAGSPVHRRFSSQTVILAGLIGAFRLLPAAFCLSSRQNRFLSGYPTLTELLAGFAVLRTPDYPVTGAAFGEMGWWEYDIYVGLAGLAFLVWFGAGRGLFGSNSETDHRSLRLPVAVMTLLSMSDVWAFVAFAPVPFAAMERVSSRFIVLPFVFLLALGCNRISREASRWGRWAKAGLLVLLMLTGLELLQHSVKWRPAEMERQIREGRLEALFPPFKVMDVHIASGNRPGYVPVLVASGVVSLGGLALALFCLRRRETAVEIPGNGNCPSPPLIG